MSEKPRPATYVFNVAQPSRLRVAAGVSPLLCSVQHRDGAGTRSRDGCATCAKQLRRPNCHHQPNSEPVDLHHKIGFVSVIGGQSYFNVANLSVLMTQLRGSKPEELAAAVERYDILKYELNGDTMDVWSADRKFVRAAIEAGKIKGHGVTIEDSMENPIRFIESSPPALWGHKFTYTRVK